MTIAIGAITARGSGPLTYGVAPPKAVWDAERVAEVARKQTARLRALPIDAVVVYDVQDESARTNEPRPFPYMRCVNPATYAFQHLADVGVPKIVYHSVPNDDEEGLARHLKAVDHAGGLAVLVGAPSREQRGTLSLNQAYAQRRREHPNVGIGGVVIAERHHRDRTEHERILRKVDQGCSFFVSQAVYSSEAAKDVLSDLKLACDQAERPVPPVLVTLTPCGSPQTLSFIEWLGVYVPPWFQNELLHSSDTLSTSVKLCLGVFRDLHEFAARKMIPLGCNVESVSLRLDEIDASVELVESIHDVLMA
jgi:hypothetical protein